MGKWKTRKTVEQFIEQSKATHGEKYDYSKAVYLTNRTKVEIICPDHGSFMQEPANHINGSRCPACAGVKRTTLDDFLAKAKKAHGDKYDYSKVEYRGVDAKVTIICQEHGEFQQIAYDHMNGRGCARCGAIKCATSNRHDLEQFIAEARKLHGDTFDYSKAVYINSTTPIEIVCHEHGSFWQVPHDHKTRYGCQACAGLAPISADEFISRATETHGDRYAYDASTYTAYRKPAGITCRSHGQFWQIPKDHAEGSGCPSCASEQTSSRAEREIADWLEAMGEQVIRNDRKVLSGMEIDIYLPERKIGIEYNGAYWHQEGVMPHPRSHEAKAKRADKLGIRLITVWDFDWSNKQDFIRQHIMHAIGRNQGPRISARTCDVLPVSFDQARPFYDRHHIQGSPWRAQCHYGLFSSDTMVACMSFGQGNSRRGRSGNSEWELLRFATSAIVRGGAGKLFAAFVAEYGPEAVWSFSDRQHFGGGLYLALNFTMDGEVAADYRVYLQNKGKMWHKAAWKRKHIQARLDELGIDDSFDPDTDPRTEKEMQRIARVTRIMDAGKIRWKWQKKEA